MNEREGDTVQSMSVALSCEHSVTTFCSRDLTDWMNEEVCTTTRYEGKERKEEKKERKE